MTDDQYNCENCDCPCERESVDVGVGVIHGPRGCPLCSWSADPEYDRSKGISPAQQRSGDTRYVDQYGVSHSVERIAEKAAQFGFDKEEVKEAFRF